jgi:cellulose synthase/poly-beta-1,6-N-acetylglucosamine synthase-like glycosyltransferase
MTKHPRIAAIVPTMSKDIDELLCALAAQTHRLDEIQVVKGVRPNGRARNRGVAKTTADILFFIDDDAMPGSADLVERLVSALLSDPTIGVVGPARVLPANASWFQRRVAAEIPRTVNPIPRAPLETNPPLNGYGHSLITTTACAMWRCVYEESGRFSEELESGVDTDFFYRARKLGYRFMMMPDIFVEHPAPGNLRALLRKFHWYGMGYGQEVQRRPDQHMGPRLPTPLHRIAFLTAATLWLVPSIFIPYSYGYPHLEVGFRPLKALSTYAVAWGYVRAWQGKIR